MSISLNAKHSVCVRLLYVLGRRIKIIGLMIEISRERCFASISRFWMHTTYESTFLTWKAAENKTLIRIYYNMPISVIFFKLSIANSYYVINYYQDHKNYPGHTATGQHLCRKLWVQIWIELRCMNQTSETVIRKVN